MHSQIQSSTEKQRAIVSFLGLCEAATKAEAQYYLELCEFDIQKAILCYFENPTAGKRAIHKNQLIEKYVKYLSEKGGPSSKKQSVLECIDRCTRRICQQLKILWRQLIPNTIRGLSNGEMFQDRFGVSLHWVVFEECGLEAALKRAADVERPLVVFEYLQNFFQNAMTVFTIETTQLLNWQYLSLGISRQDHEVRKFLRQSCGIADSEEFSSLTILRVNHCKEVVLVSHLKLTQNVNAMNVYNYFHENLAAISEEKTLQTEVIGHVQQSLKRNEDPIQPASPLSHISHQAHHSSELMEPEFDMQVSHWQRNAASDREIKLIQEQQLQQSEEEYRRRKQEALQSRMIEERQLKQLEELTAKRKLRKMSLSGQPSAGNNVITIGFRLPKGGRILRRFDRNSTISEMFQFIELNEQVEFDNEKDRSFDLLTILDGKSLRSMQSSTLEQLFGNEQQQTLLVKQL